MNTKVLENLKHLNLEENDLILAINNSFELYINNSQQKIDENIKTNVNLQKGFSCLIRFFRCINSNKKFEEETLVNSIKEILKDKTKSITILIQKVKEIISVQSTRINFTDRLIKRKLNYLSNAKFNKVEGNYIHLLTNFSFKISVSISNNYSNRLLTPEIYLYISLDNGTTLCIFLDMKVFQELRKSLAFHIKKIIDNENVNFLK